MVTYVFVWITEKHNACTHPRAYPLIRLEESHMALEQSYFFSMPDLTNEYWQIPVTEGLQKFPLV